MVIVGLHFIGVPYVWAWAIRFSIYCFLEMLHDVLCKVLSMEITLEQEG